MICPVCNNPLVVLEYRQIEIDYCPHCQGTWFDAGELELCLKAAGWREEDTNRSLASILESEGVKEKGRKCPICHRVMRKTAFGERPGIIIDACQNKDGLWFDGGEIDALLKAAMGKATAPDAHHPVTGFLAEVFKGRGKT